MDKDVRENADRGKQEDKNEICHLALMKDCLGTCFTRILKLQRKNNNFFFEKSKGSREEL
jgi:hypothetical protein